MKLMIPHIHRGIPDDLNDTDYFDVHTNKCLIIDDLMTSVRKDERITNLFCQGAHHRNLSVIYLLQNLYYHGRDAGTISLNTHYLTLFKNPRDLTQVYTLARQMRPYHFDTIIQSFQKATKQPYEYLLFDLKPET